MLEKKKRIISVIEGVWDQIEGVLYLSTFDNKFWIYWTPLDFSANQLLNSYKFEPSTYTGNIYEHRKPFVADANDLHFLKLDGNPLRITLIVDLARTFSIEDANPIDVIEFIRSIITEGVACITSDPPYSLIFNKILFPHFFTYVDPSITIKCDSIKDIDALWKSIQDFSVELYMYLCKSKMMPHSPQFPLKHAVLNIYKTIISKIPRISKYEPISDISSYINDDGTLNNFEKLKDEIYFKGLTNECLKKLIFHLTGIYSPDKTSQENEEQLNILKNKFHKLETQLETTTPEQVQNKKAIENAFIVIKHDINRTDRYRKAFKEQDAKGLYYLAKLLNIYALYNPSIAYLQGMNDLFVPIMLLLVPDWDDNGNPLDENGNIMDEYDFLPATFWIFVGLMKTLNHEFILSSVAENCQKYAAKINEILRQASPMTWVWHKEKKIDDMFYMFPDCVILYKRSLEDNIWNLWVKFLSAKDTKTILIYFIAAIVLNATEAFLELTEDCSTVVMGIYNGLLPKVDINMIADYAFWMSQNYPISADGLFNGNNVEMPKNRTFYTFED